MSSQPPPGGADQSHDPPQIDSKSTMQPQYTGGGTAIIQPQYANGGLPAVQPQYTAGGTLIPHPPGAHPPEYVQPHVYDPNMPKPSSSGEHGSPVPAPQEVGAPRVYQVAMPLVALNESTAPVDCPVCGQRALTWTEYNVGNTTHVWALILLLAIGLPCIPYFMNSTKDVKHSCGNCGVHLATWKRGGHIQVFQYA